MRYYLNELLLRSNQYNAGNKARADIHEVIHTYVEDLNEVPPLLNDENKIAKLIDRKKYEKQLKSTINSKLHPGDEVIMNFPTIVGDIYHLISLLKKKKVIVIVFLHDLDGLRFQNKVLDIYVKKCLQLIDVIFTPTHKMSEYIKTNYHINGKIIEQFIFPYLNSTLNDQRTYDIAYAANLDPATFLSKISDELVNKYKLVLFGSGYKENYKGLYKGAIAPDELVSKLDAKYLLIWNGSSIDDLTGNYGNYMKYNWPYKFSLAIAARKPVIISELSAIAPIIKKENLGIVVKSLDELPAILENISESMYNTFLTNIDKFRTLVVTDEGIKISLSKL